MSRAARLWIHLRLVLLALLIANASWSAEPPDSVTVELITDHWNGWLGRHQLDTAVVSVHTAQAFPESLRDWRLEEPALRPVFVAGRIVAHDRLWIRLPLPVVVPRAAIGGRRYEASHDSVLLSTSARHLGTNTRDAGIDYDLRVVTPRMASSRHQRRIDHHVRGVGQLNGTLFSPDPTLAQGLFRLLATYQDQVTLPGRNIKENAVIGRFRRVERWGLPWTPPDTELTVVWRMMNRNADTETTARRVLRTRPGMRVVLQAERREGDAFWTGFEGESFAVVDSASGVLYDNDLPLNRLSEVRTAVRASCWSFEHPWLTRIVGQVEHAEASRTRRPTRVRLLGTAAKSSTDLLGRFELAGLPIGHGELEFKQGRRRWRALVELSDERLDTLEVVLH